MGIKKLMITLFDPQHEAHIRCIETNKASSGRHRAVSIPSSLYPDFWTLLKTRSVLWAVCFQLKDAARSRPLAERVWAR